MMEIVIIGIGSFVLGYYIRGIIFQYAIKHVLKTAEEIDVEDLDDESGETRNVITSTIEIHDGVYYMYSTDEPKRFLAQGETRYDLELALKERFPNTYFSLSADDLKKII